MTEKKKPLVGLPRNFKKPPTKQRAIVKIDGTKNGHEIGPNDCRYIFGDPGRGGIETKFCGKPCKEGSSYCEEHHRLCFDGKAPKYLMKAPRTC